MAHQPITILGAGIAGLTLGRCLQQRGIPAILYDKASAHHPRDNYGITLQPWAYRPLLRELDVNETAFRRQTAVDGPDGIGSIVIGADRGSAPANPSSSSSSSPGFLAHRGALDAFLARGLNIRRGSVFQEVALTEDGVVVSFESGEALRSALVVGADGVHSALRKTLVPHARLSVLPCVVFNGKRRVDRERFQALYASHFKDTNSIEARQKDVLLRVSLSKLADESVDLSYTYSRLPHPKDALHNPTRSNAAATEIPEAFFAEVAALGDLEQPFADVFDVERLRKDRLLHWLMRSILVNHADLERLAGHGIVMIGDSVHAQPILGGQGANAAIHDGLDLADFIAEHRQNAAQAIAKFYEPRYQRWKKGVSMSEHILSFMHKTHEESAML